MAIIVISGGPGVGKTSVLHELNSRGHKVMYEAARKISMQDSRFLGKSIQEINKKQFQDEILKLQIQQTKKFSKIKGLVFSDRGFGDTIAYYKIHDIPFRISQFIEDFQYEAVFLLDILPHYENDNLRTESKKEQIRIHNEIMNTYKKMNQKIIHVPIMSIKKRTDFILEKINNYSE